MAEHHCHARGCGTKCKPEYLMCPPHWRKVPRRLQLAVWRKYRPGQCDDKNPSEAWHVAADAAIGFVAVLDEQPVRECEHAALKAAGCDIATDNLGKRYVFKVAT